MTPRSKADQLLIKFKMSECTHGYNDVRDLHAANRCAIIAVDEMLNEYPSQVPKDSYEMERHLYWIEVKNELEKL
jgi:hypothetical protein